jgi:hypothetical protein
LETETLTGDVVMEGTETRVTREGGDTVGIEEFKIASLHEEAEGMLSPDQEKPKRVPTGPFFTTPPDNRGTRTDTPTRTGQTSGQGHGPSEGDKNTLSHTHLLFLHQDTEGH